MLSVVRAGLVVAMLAGFYATALLQLCLAIALCVWLATQLNGVLALKITMPLFFATVGAVGVAMWKAIRARPEPAHGVTVGPDQSPELWNAVHYLARMVGTRVPDEIRLVPEVNAAVQEDSRLLGLIGGRRYLYIGVPLLQSLSVSQMFAVLAHELGHYSGLHTRLGAVAYRGRLTIGGTIGRIGPYNVAGWGFRAYARLYLLVDSAVIRRQELEADRAAVRVAGRAAAAGALRELPILDAAWGFFFRQYVRPAWEAGFVPDDLFSGFGHLLAGRRRELDELRGREPAGTGSRWDTHPPIAARISAIATAPETQIVPDPRPAAAVLLPQLPALARRLQGEMLEVGDRKVLPWEHATAEWLRGQTQREADAVFRAVGRVAGSDELTLAAVLELSHADRLGEAAQRMFPEEESREAALRRFAEPMESLIQVAAVNSGVAYWRHSWSGPAQLVRRDGSELPPLREIAEQAVWPQTAYRAWHSLHSLGIDAASATLVEKRATAVGAGAIAALSNVKLDGVEYDLILLDRGFVFVSAPGKADEGKSRLQRTLQSMPIEELASRYQFLPYEEIAAVTVTKRVPTRAGLALHDGRRLELQETWGSELITKNSRDVLLAVFERIGE
jgi:Zn-dependent protease with chaperone function